MASADPALLPAAAAPCAARGTTCSYVHEGLGLHVHTPVSLSVICRCTSAHSLEDEAVPALAETLLEY